MPKATLPVDGKVTVGRAHYDVGEAYEALKIDPNHTYSQLAEQSALYAYWSTLSEEANIEAEVARRRLELVEAELDGEYRKQARADNEKITEDGLKRRITRDDEYQDTLDRLMDKKRDAAMLGIIRRALEQRLSILIALNNRDRAEMVAVNREDREDN